jgi:hypothetical protein
MRPFVFVSMAALAVVGAASCGLSVGGLAEAPSDGGIDGSLGEDGPGLGNPGGSGDAGPGDSGPPPGDGGGPVDASSDGPATNGDANGCSVANGCYVIPSGWHLVAFAGSQGSACPTGFGTPTNLYEGPNTSDVCDCPSCTVGTAPSCASGAIGVFFGLAGDTTCATAATPPQNNNNPPGACLNDLPKTAISGISVRLVPANQPTGGTCTSPGVGDTVPFAASDESCAPTSAQAAGCTGNTCTPSIPAPFHACVAKAGATSCPAGSPFSALHVVGTGYTLTCSGCSCTISATCSGGTMELYTDQKCNTGELALAADGGCYPTGAPANVTYQSYEYAANPPTNVSCAATGSSTPSGSLQNEEAICCVP